MTYNIYNVRLEGESLDSSLELTFLKGSLPKVGEDIELEKKGSYIFYEVVNVIHSVRRCSPASYPTRTMPLVIVRERPESYNPLKPR